MNPTFINISEEVFRPKFSDEPVISGKKSNNKSPASPERTKVSSDASWKKSYTEETRSFLSQYKGSILATSPAARKSGGATTFTALYSPK